MDQSRSILTSIGQPLLVVSVLGKSLGTLLGPTEATKMVQTGLSGCECNVISSSPTVLLRAMDIVHPVGTIFLQTLEGAEEAYGTGSTYLAALCGTLSTACSHIQLQGVPANAIINGLRVAEDLCTGVLRDLSVPIKDVARGLQEASINSTSKGFRRGDGDIDDLEDKQQHREFSRNKSGVAFLTVLAAGLHHNASSGGAIRTHERTEEETPVSQGLSLPAALAVDALSALGIPNVSGEESTAANDVAQLARVCTRLLVGPDSASSFVAPGAAVIDILPEERAEVGEAFARRRGSNVKQSGKHQRVLPLPRAVATVFIEAVVVVLGDLSASAGTSNAASYQTPTTQIFRSAEALASRSVNDNSESGLWAENVSLNLERFGVDILLATGDVCSSLRQLLALRGVVVLSGCLQEEVEAAASASGATPVPTIDVLTRDDVGTGRDRNRGLQFEERQHESCARRFEGLAASILDVGVVSEERNVFVAEVGKQMGSGLEVSDVVLMLYHPTLDNIGNIEKWSGAEANVIVWCCGTTLSICEELKYRFWRVVRRVTGALTEGVVLPGAGAPEIACAASLEFHAQRLEIENSCSLDRSSIIQLYTPMVLRAMAEALDEVRLLCTMNAGQVIYEASRQLSAAKNAAAQHLSRHQSQTAMSSRLPMESDSSRLRRCCPDWSSSLELAAVSLSAISGDSTVGTILECDGSSKSGERSQDDNDSSPGHYRYEEAIVLDNYGARIGCLERAVRLVALLVGTDGILLAPKSS